MRHLITTILMSIILGGTVFSQCDITKNHGQGYTTTLTNVTLVNNNYEIQVLVEHDGCPGPGCKSVSHYSVEAAQSSYSNISVSNIVGSFNYGGVDMGWNLGGDPFNGFRLSSTSGMGAGLAGSFELNYTISALQSQQFLIKAGNSQLIVTFSVADFNAVLNCAPDTDGDGISDANDDYPNDGTRAFDSYFPASGTATLAFEDLWPSQGDYDFNDLVVDYSFQTVTDASDYVVELFASFTVRAF